MNTRQSEPDERFEAARVKRARADLEETVQGLRQRREPSAFAVAYVPQHAEERASTREREDRRIADERAGRPTKPFAEMDGIEIFFAMASYPGPGHYPQDLEAIVQEMAERPVPDLTASDQEALSEVISIRQRAEAGERETWMAKRLSELAEHPTPSVNVAAMGLCSSSAKRSSRPRDGGGDAAAPRRAEERSERRATPSPGLIGRGPSSRCRSPQPSPGPHALRASSPQSPPTPWTGRQTLVSKSQ